MSGAVRTKNNCCNHLSLPVHYNDWDRLFTQSQTPKCGRHCHCKFIAKPIQPDDLDITLAGLILKECCSLTTDEETAVDVLRKFKNNYLSHNTDGCISLDEFNTLWRDLTIHVLQLDNNKEDDLIRIMNRPLDEVLCQKYNSELLDIHKKLDEVDNTYIFIFKYFIFSFFLFLLWIYSFKHCTFECVVFHWLDSKSNCN